jgi:hypothetical protein
MFESFAAAFTTAKKISGEMYVLSSRTKRFGTEAKNSLTWTKRAALWRQSCVHWSPFVSNSLFVTANKLFKSLKTNLVRGPEVGWKRYALVTFLLVSVTLEIFFFGGANILLAPNYMLRPSTTLNDAVDTMFGRIKRDPVAISSSDNGRIKQDPVTISPSDNNKERQAMVVKPTNVRPRAPEPELSRPATRQNRPETSRWTTINTARGSSSLARTAPEKQTVLAAVKEPSVSEPILPTKNVENSPAKLQLNIKWEN